MAALDAGVTMPGGFVPAGPTRILDTRNGHGAPQAQVASHHSLTLQVTGAGGVPSAGVASVVLNLTVTGTHGHGYLTAYPAGSGRPTASNVNFVAQQTVANLATVRLGTGGKVVLYNGSTGAADLVADVAGYYLSGTAIDAGSFTTLTPARVLDTRYGTGAARAPVKAQSVLTVTVGGHGGVPSTGVTAVVLNVTATRTHSTGYVTAYASGATRPSTSNLNFTAGATVPNLVTAGVSPTGQVALYNGSHQPVDLLADVAGYYRSGPATKGGAYVAITPTRYLDTRSRLGVQFGPLFSRGTVSVQVLYRGGTGTTHASGVPVANVSAVVSNVTATNERKGGYVKAYPLSPHQPTVSNLSFSAAATRANAAIVPAGTCGQLSFFNGGSDSIDLLADASGYFLAADAAAPATPVKTVRAWGGDEFGGLGNGTFDGRDTPVTVLGVSGVESVSVSQQALALRSDHTVSAWGVNYYGELGTGEQLGDDQGYAGCAIPVTVPGLSGVAQVAAGATASYALKSDGTVWAWGDNEDHQLGDGTATSHLTPHQVPGLTGVSAIAAGPFFALALKSDGAVWGWGSESFGELGTGEADHPSPIQIAPTVLTGIAAISAGNVDSYALTGDGHVYVWGANDFGERGDGSAPDTGPHPTPALVPGLSGVTQISGGLGEAPLALLADRTVRSWGINESGQLGTGQSPSTKFYSNVPVAVAALSNVTAVSGGPESATALEGDGSVWTWGAPHANATSTEKDTPTMVPGLTGVTGIAQGAETGIAIVP